jgi:hypothetical protein
MRRRIGNVLLTQEIPPLVLQYILETNDAEDAGNLQAYWGAL